MRLRAGGAALVTGALKACQVVPSNLSNCICLIGAKSSALVETLMPGSSIGSFSSRMLAACFMMFS